MVEHSWRRGAYSLSNDPEKTDVAMVADYLAASYWAKHVPRDKVIASLRSSLVYNLTDDRTGEQIGFARVVSDQCRFAYICDVFVLDACQGQGLGQWLIKSVMADPVLAAVDHWVLATSDAQPFYRKLGFVEAVAGRYMVLKKPVEAQGETLPG